MPLHCGVTNCILTAQLAVVAPKSGAATTAADGDSKEIAEGACLVLDDSFEHERRVEADADCDLVLLIVQFFHPDVPAHVKSPEGLRLFAPP